LPTPVANPPPVGFQVFFSPGPTHADSSRSTARSTGTTTTTFCRPGATHRRTLTGLGEAACSSIAPIPLVAGPSRLPGHGRAKISRINCVRIDHAAFRGFFDVPLLVPEERLLSKMISGAWCAVASATNFIQLARGPTSVAGSAEIAHLENGPRDFRPRRCRRVQPTSESDSRPCSPAGHAGGNEARAFHPTPTSKGAFLRSRLYVVSWSLRSAGILRAERAHFRAGSPSGGDYTPLDAASPTQPHSLRAHADWAALGEAGGPV